MKNTPTAAETTKDKEDWVFPLNIPENGFMKWAKINVGKLMLVIKPGLKNKLLGGYQPGSKFERGALAALIITLKKKGDVENLAKLHRSLWKSRETLNFYASTDLRLEKMIRETWASLKTALNKLIKAHDIKNLVEVGCGTGKLMHYISKEFPVLERVIGVDINESQIVLNKKNFEKESRMEFHTSDANSWLVKFALDDTVYLTYGGVFEYFTQKQLREFLKLISEKQNTGLILFEPVINNYEAYKGNSSTLFGEEMSFSHPYHHLLADAGFKVQFEEYRNSWGYFWLMLSASKK